MVGIKASNFKFVPSNIVTYQGDVIAFSIDNLSGASHNFTLEDPAGKVLQDIDLPTDKVVDVEVRFSELGTYKF